MSKNFCCRPPPERDGVWMKDRFYGTPTTSHYQSTAGARDRDRVCAGPHYTLPRKFGQLETLRTTQLQFPFTMHDNRYQHELRGENLKGTYRKARPCCVRRQHTESNPDAFVDTAGRPTSEQRLKTTARETYQVPVGVAPVQSRRFPHEHSCPFTDDSCDHWPAAERRCEPAGTGPPAATAPAGTAAL